MRTNTKKKNIIMKKAIKKAERTIDMKAITKVIEEIDIRV